MNGDAIKRVLSAYRSTTGHITEAEIVAAWAEFDALRSVFRRLAANSDVHPCADCSLPTNYGVGSYWLAPDDLWDRVVGTNTVTLCPGCFAYRAESSGLDVSWRAVVAQDQSMFRIKAKDLRKGDEVRVTRLGGKFLTVRAVQETTAGVVQVEMEWGWPMPAVTPIVDVFDPGEMLTVRR